MCELRLPPVPTKHNLVSGGLKLHTFGGENCTLGSTRADPSAGHREEHADFGGGSVPPRFPIVPPGATGSGTRVVMPSETGR